MDSLKKSLDNMGNQNTSSSKPSADTQNQDVKKTTIAPTRKTADGRIVETNPPVDPCASKPGEPTTPGRARGVNCLPNSGERASVSDWTVQMKKDMAEQQRKMDPDGTRANYKNLRSEADSVYRCAFGNKYMVTKGKVRIFDTRDVDITNKFSNVRVEKNNIYYNENAPQIGIVNRVFDTTELKVFSRFKNPSDKSDAVTEEPCKKIK
jgi:hypothetical protein